MVIELALRCIDIEFMIKLFRENAVQWIPLTKGQ